MQPASANPIAYRFGPFRLNIADRILERNGERVQLTPKVIDTLFVLVENAGQVVTKELIMKSVWPEVNVVESGLTRNISSLRKALEENAEDGAFIETIPRRGYRFVAPIDQEMVQEEQAEQIEIPVVPAAAPIRPRTRNDRYLWIALAVAGICVSVAVWALWKPNRSAPKVEAPVRIGEHLLYKLAPDETVRASEHFEQAIAANPASSRAHAGLAISLVHLLNLGVRPAPEVLPRAEQAARKSLELNPASSPAHYATGMIRMFKDWNFRAAEAEFRRALALDPQSVQVRIGLGRLKIATGEIAEARRFTEEALDLDPASPPLGAQYCCVFYYQRDFRRAESECRKVLDREPGYALAHYYLALSLGFLGRIDEANDSLNRSGLMPGVVEADRAWLRLRNGDRRLALEALERRQELIRQRKVDATAKLLLAASLERFDEAFDALETAVSTRAPEVLTLAVEPRLDPIRADPRYAALLRRIGSTH